MYIQISANYMFRPLLVRSSSGWIPSLSMSISMDANRRSTTHTVTIKCDYMTQRTPALTVDYINTSQLHHRSQMPSSHTSTTNEPLLHNNIPAAATGYILERTHGYNSGPLWHRATRPNNAGTPSLPGSLLAYR